jgi:hypothetical protein
MELIETLKYKYILRQNKPNQTKQTISKSKLLPHRHSPPLSPPATSLPSPPLPSPPTSITPKPLVVFKTARMSTSDEGFVNLLSWGAGVGGRSGWFSNEVRRDRSWWNGSGLVYFPVISFPGIMHCNRIEKEREIFSIGSVISLIAEDIFRGSKKNGILEFNIFILPYLFCI